jgi:hypothetical protein
MARHRWPTAIFASTSCITKLPCSSPPGHSTSSPGSTARSSTHYLVSVRQLASPGVAELSDGTALLHRTMLRCAACLLLEASSWRVGPMWSLMTDVSSCISPVSYRRNVAGSRGYRPCCTGVSTNRAGFPPWISQQACGAASSTPCRGCRMISPPLAVPTFRWI